MKFSHLKNNKEIRMVDISKKVTERKAQAIAIVKFKKKKHLKKYLNETQKGEIFNTARIAGIIGAKKTSDLNSTLS